MIKNIIFDIGDVLVSYSSLPYCIKNNLPFDKLEKANQLLIHDKRWRQLLNGLIDEKEVREKLTQKNPNYQQEFEILLKKEFVSELLLEIKENSKILKQLHQQGYNIYLLSNVTKETLEATFQKFDFSNDIQGGVYSYQEHISKPDKQIYEILCNRYQLKLEECIFIDDRKKNVEVAESLGMIGIHYQNQMTLVEEIQKKIGGCE